MTSDDLFYRARWGQPLPLDVPDHYAEGDSSDGVPTAKDIAIGMGMGIVLWLAVAWW
jgi:hypothetical protein